MRKRKRVDMIAKANRIAGAAYLRVATQGQPYNLARGCRISFEGYYNEAKTFGPYRCPAEVIRLHKPADSRRKSTEKTANDCRPFWAWQDSRLHKEPGEGHTEAYSGKRNNNSRDRRGYINRMRPDLQPRQIPSPRTNTAPANNLQSASEKFLPFAGMARCAVQGIRDIWQYLPLLREVAIARGCDPC